MKKAAVIDASLAAMWVIPEPFSAKALSLVHHLPQEGINLIAPSLILTEITNALYKRVVRGEINLPAALEGLNIILDFDIEIYEEAGLHARAMELSHRLNRPSTYDCHYLALAEIHECPFWTGDKKFYNAAANAYPRVKWIGHHLV